MIKHLSQTLKLLPKNPNLVILISHVHTCNKPLIPNPAIDFVLDEFKDIKPCNQVKNPTQNAPKTAEPVETGLVGIRISHPWPEWVGLMEKLIRNGYFNKVGNPFQNGGVVDGKSCNQIRTACLNFARDRPDLMSYFMSRDIKTVAGSGCPSVDRKVVNSGKRMRAYVGIDEGHVCSSCILRGKCERAYVKARENEGGRTVDVMRLVLTYGVDHIARADDNEPFISKRVEEAIRSLIKDMVKSSKNKLNIDDSKQIPSVHRSQSQNQEHRFTIPTTQADWNCPKLQGVRNKREHVQLKKGDWLCIRCNYLNFAKNTRCLQCHTDPPKRELNYGEWVCDSCNYINFKRNTVCLKCDHKRPKALNSSSSSTQLNYDDT